MPKEKIEKKIQTPQKNPAEDALLDQSEKKMEIVEKRGLIWEDIKEEEINALSKEEDLNKRISLLCSIFQYEHYEDNQKSKLWIDICFNAFNFAKDEAKLENEKISIFISILKKTYFNAFESFPTMKENYELFTTLMRRHSIEITPDSTNLFNSQEVELIVDYITSTFYRHYKAYQYTHKFKSTSIQEVRYIQVDTPLIPIPLSEAVSDLKTL